MTNRPSKRWSLAVYEKEVQDMEQDKIQTTKVTKEVSMFFAEIDIKWTPSGNI